MKPLLNVSALVKGTLLGRERSGETEWKGRCEEALELLPHCAEMVKGGARRSVRVTNDLANLSAWKLFGSNASEFKPMPHFLFCQV